MFAFKASMSWYKIEIVKNLKKAKNICVFVYTNQLNKKNCI